MDTGRKVMQLAPEHIKPVVLELGGKSPILVFDDAEPDVVAAEACKGIYSNTGQYCDAGSRFVVVRRSSRCGGGKNRQQKPRHDGGDAG